MLFNSQLTYEFGRNAISVNGTVKDTHEVQYLREEFQNDRIERETVRRDPDELNLLFATLAEDAVCLEYHVFQIEEESQHVLIWKNPGRLEEALEETLGKLVEKIKSENVYLVITFKYF